VGLKNIWNSVNYGSSEIKYKSATEVYKKWNNNNLIDKKIKGIKSYSNLGYHILGFLIEKITEKKYSEFVNYNILVPLKMTNTGIEDCNITLYDSKLKKFNKFQKWERTFASSAGELKSSIDDLIKFSNFTRLLKENSLDLLKIIYVYKENENEIKISHDGAITGGQTKFYIDYDKKWNVKNVYISLKTG
jgi:hypothetical protein